MPKDSKLKVVSAVSTRGILYLPEKGVLLIKRSKKSASPGFWEFPGGKVKEGETPEECLRRELEEGINISARVGGEFLGTTFDYPTWTIKLLVYRAEITGGEMRLNVHNDVRWVSREELHAYDFCPADVELVERLTAK